MKRLWMEAESHSEDPHTWIGREAAVGTQAEQYLRYRGRRGEWLFIKILSLSFIGGLTLGCALCHLWKNKTK
jgi:predicted small integral membrane protein